MATINPSNRRQRLLLWIAEHDDRWLFTVLYIGLAVVLSILISLFWLVVVVAAHAALEWYALRHRQVPEPVLGRVLWHIKLDLALILFALWLGLYMETLFGLIGLGGAARVGVQASARFVAWQKALRGVLLTLDDAAQVAKVVVARRRGGKGEADAAEAEDSAIPPWRLRWTGGDRFAVGFGALMLLLILLAPLLTQHDFGSMWIAMATDLHPWPAD